MHHLHPKQQINTGRSDRQHPPAQRDRRRRGRAGGGGQPGGQRCDRPDRHGPWPDRRRGGL